MMHLFLTSAAIWLGLSSRSQSRAEFWNLRKFVIGIQSITPQCSSDVFPSRARPNCLRTQLWAPSQPTTYLAWTVVPWSTTVSPFSPHTLYELAKRILIGYWLVSETLRSLCSDIGLVPQRISTQSWNATKFWRCSSILPWAKVASWNLDRPAWQLLETLTRWISPDDSL